MKTVRHKEDVSRIRYLRVSGVWTSDNRLLLRPSYLSENPRESFDFQDSPLQAHIHEGEKLLLRWGIGVGVYSDSLTEPSPFGRDSQKSRAQAFRPVRAKIPWPATADRIGFRREEIVLLEVHRPARAPSITDLSVKNNGKRYDISWRGKHPEGVPIFYHVRTSADGGRSWHRLASRLSETGIAVPQTALIGGKQCIVEVVAYDGINTVHRSISVPKSGSPQLEVMILSPSESKERVRPPVVLEAVGRITGRFSRLDELATCVWTADGKEIAQGAYGLWEDPKPGRQEITVRANAGGLAASAKVLVTIAG